MREHILWLVQFMGVGNSTTLKILRHYGNSEDAYKDIIKGNQGFLKPREKIRLQSASIEKSKNIINLAKEYRYEIVTIEDDSYPANLRNIANPPPVLFVKGNISIFNEYLSIAVVGTRTPTDYSYKVTDSICGALAKNEIIVVSGMAVGIDKAAHTAAIDKGGMTAGILASGFDIDYPKNSMAFREYIVDKGGVVITEQLPGGRSEKWYFSLRNRIISGISSGTLVIQAGVKSGCALTANSALEQNRDLFCVPPADIFDYRYGGVIPLLRDGAIPVFSAKDILESYSIEGLSIKSSYKTPREIDRILSQSVNGDDETDFQEAAPKKRESEKKTQSENMSEEKTQPQKETPSISRPLTDAEEAVYSLLSNEPYHLDYLIKESGISTNDVNEALLDLELEGLIEPVGGGNFIRVD